MKVAQLTVKDAEKAVQKAFHELCAVPGVKVVKENHAALSAAAQAFAKSVQVLKSAKSREATDPVAALLG